MILAMKIHVINKIISNYALNDNNSNMIYSGNFSTTNKFQSDQRTVFVFFG